MDGYPFVGFALVAVDDSGGKIVGLGHIGGDEVAESVGAGG